MRLAALALLAGGVALAQIDVSQDGVYRGRARNSVDCRGTASSCTVQDGGYLRITTTTSTLADGGIGFVVPPVCQVGSQNFLGWDGGAWQCGAITPSGSSFPVPPVCGPFDGGTSFLGWDGGTWACVAASFDGGLRAPDFAFASTTAWGTYPAYEGLPASDGCFHPSQVTGTHGEPINGFARASPRWCATGGLDTNEPTGVWCDAGYVCLQDRKLLAWRSVENRLVRSEEFDNASWTKAFTGDGGSGGTVNMSPSVTANTTVAPDGTTTADTVTISACPNPTMPAPNPYIGDSSQIYQNGGCSAAVSADSIWMKGTGSVALCTYAPGICEHVTLTSSWVRYRVHMVANQSGASVLVIGCTNNNNDYKCPSCQADAGNTDTGAATVILWGAYQTCSPGYTGPYVQTAGSRVTSAGEVFHFGWDSTNINSWGSSSFDFYPTWASDAGITNWAGLSTNGTSGRQAGWTTVPGYPAIYDSTNTVRLASGWTHNTTNRIGAKWDGGVMCIKNATTSAETCGTFDNTMGNSASAGVGYNSTTLHGDGLFGNVCIDRTLRCYP